MRIYILFILALIISSNTFAQKVSGKVQDTTGVPLTNVSVMLNSGSEKLSTLTNIDGFFLFPNVVSDKFVLTFTSVGFLEYTKHYIRNKGSQEYRVSTVQLKQKIDALSEIIIQKNPISIKEDTIQYNAGSYKVREGAPVEDVIKKLPGVTVDKDGNVTAQGETVKRIRVNGKDYFGGDVQTATKNLPADIIDNIQIIDDYGEKANLTGIKDGEPEKIINITIKKGKDNGHFGNAGVGAGTEGRYTGRLSANSFKEDRQISVLGSVNNINGNTFDFNGGGRGGGARGKNFGSAERGGSGGDGNTTAHSIGLNYRDMWGEKITSYGSFSFSRTNNNTTGTSFRQDMNPENTRTTSSTGNNGNSSVNQRLTWNLEYRMDTANFLKVTPYYSYASSGGNNRRVSDITALINDTTYYTLNKSRSVSNATTPAMGTDLLFNHKFNKTGRNLTFTSSIDYSARSQQIDALNDYHDSTAQSLIATDSLRHQLIGTNAENTNTGIQISYSEPIGKFTNIEASYSWNNSSTKSIRDASDINLITGEKLPNIPQSNDYKYRFITNQYGLILNQRKVKYNFLLGIMAQPSNLTGMDYGRKIETTSRNFNFAPRGRFAYNFARRNSLTITYGGSSREPAFAQLQPVADSSNSKNIIIGNPGLKPEFTNRLMLQYHKIGVLNGTSLFSHFSFDQTQDKIVRSSVNAAEGTGRTTSYLNTKGFYGLNGNFSFTKSFNNRKYSATVSASGSFDNNISYTDNQRNVGQNWIWRPSASFRMDIEDIIDVNLNGGYAMNHTITNYPDYTSRTQVRSLELGIDGKNYFFTDWTFGYDATKMINSGYFSTVHSNPTLINLYIERRFLKKNTGTLRIQGYDLLNQNTGISRTVNGTTITDVQNNRLGRYFLLSFNLRIEKFGGKRFPGNGGNK